MKVLPSLLDQCQGLLNQNRVVLDIIDQVADRYGKTPAGDLKEQVYKMKTKLPRGKVMTVQDIPQKEIILFRSSDRPGTGYSR